VAFEACGQSASQTYGSPQSFSSLVASPLFWGFCPGGRVSRRADVQAIACRHLRSGPAIRWPSRRGLIKSMEAKRSGELAFQNPRGKLWPCVRTHSCAHPITCQSTRTHNSRRRLRRLCWWSGHFYVKRHDALCHSTFTSDV
jgi:hypothetical protein